MGKIAEFGNQYSKTNTRELYITALRAYFAFIFNMPRSRKTPIETFERLADQYLSEDRNFTQDVINFTISWGDSPPKTVRSYVAAIKEFLIFSEVEIHERDLRKIKKKMPKGGAATVEKILDIETLNIILHHCDLKMRALILLLASSGMRIGEALTLQLEDINVSRDIGHITVRGMMSNGGGAKGGNQRYTFCSGEAAEAIREWLKKRDAYLIESLNRGKGIGQVKDPHDSRLFPLSSSTVGDAWLIALKAADLEYHDAVTNRLQIHIHMLRKFFSSQARLVVPVDIVEGLMGHSGYLSDAYRRYTPKQVEEYYRKALPYVTVAIPEDIREFRDKYDQKMHAHTDIIENLVKETLQYKRDMAEMKARMNLIDGIDED